MELLYPKQLTAVSARSQDSTPDLERQKSSKSIGEMSSTFGKMPSSKSFRLHSDSAGAQSPGSGELAAGKG